MLLYYILLFMLMQLCMYAVYFLFSTNRVSCCPPLIVDRNWSYRCCCRRCNRLGIRRYLTLPSLDRRSRSCAVHYNWMRSTGCVGVAAAAVATVSVVDMRRPRQSLLRVVVVVYADVDVLANPVLLDMAEVDIVGGSGHRLSHHHYYCLSIRVVVYVIAGDYDCDGVIDVDVVVDLSVRYSPLRNRGYCEQIVGDIPTFQCSSKRGGGVVLRVLTRFMDDANHNGGNLAPEYK